MKFKLISDVHLEFGNFTIQNDGADVLVIAGDLLIVEDLYDISREDMGNRFTQQIMSTRLLKVQDFRNFLDHVSKEFKYVVYVMGNHEFYQGRFFGSILHLEEELLEYPNIFLLESGYKDIEGVRFIGGTMWSSFRNKDAIVMNDAQQLMNDYKAIRFDKNGYRKLRAMDSLNRHIQTVYYFRNTLLDTTQPVVMVTHHAPSFASVPYCYAHDTLNGAYATDLQELIFEFPNIRYWCHGHIHHSSDYMIGDTRVLCNPRGYSGYQLNENFDSQVTFEV